MATFALDQLEKIAGTILKYERDRAAKSTTYEDWIGVYAADVLATGKPNGMLSWSLNVKLGTVPTELPTGRAGSHPLDFATAFADTPEVRDQFLAKLRADIDNQLEDHRHRIGNAARIIPGPPDPELRLPRGRSHLFHPYHAAWYTTKALVKLASDQLNYRTGIGHFLWQIGAALERDGQDTTVLREVATKAVLAEVAKRAQPTTDYYGIAEAVSLADQAAVEAILTEAAGVYRILCVTLHTSQPKTMILGLKALASHKRLDLLKHMGRAPTIDELLGSNVKGAANVWRTMPWEFLRPIVIEHGSALRAALLKRVNEIKPEELRECLVDHEERFKRVKPLEESAPDLPVEERGSHHTQEWSTFAKGVRRYFPAKRLRETMLEVYPEDVARLIALRHLTNREDLAGYVDHIFDETMRTLLCAYKSPLAYNGKRFVELL